MASYNGLAKVVVMLIERGVAINAQGGLYGNALQAASWRGHEKVGEMLVDEGRTSTLTLLELSVLGEKREDSIEHFVRER